MTSKVITAALLAGMLAGVFGCASWFRKEHWADMDAAYDVDFPIVWDAVKWTLVERFDSLEYERAADGEIRTGWKEHLSFLAGQGYREQAWVKVEKDGEKGYRVKVRVLRDTNEEPVYTTVSKHARWKAADDDEAAANHLVGLIHMKLKSALDT
jgi:hypothetical protein